MKKAVIIHGWEASSKDMWFPYAKDLLKEKKFDVFTPDMPGYYFPELKKWLEELDNFAFNEESLMIGHSLGGITILRYLEGNHKVNRAIICASPYEHMGFGALENFFLKPFDFKTIKQNVDKIDLVYEQDDPLVPLEHGKWFAKKLDADLHLVPGAFHLCVPKLPILEKLLK